MRPIVKLFGKLLAPSARRFRKALYDPLKVQQAVQEQVLGLLAKSEYGKFLDIRSMADWNRIPIVEYHDIEPWIERGSLLTPEPILFYEKTSGSRGPAKLIPYTKSLRSSFNYMFCVWAHTSWTGGRLGIPGRVVKVVSESLSSFPFQSESHPGSRGVQGQTLPSSPARRKPGDRLDLESEFP